MNEEFIPAKRAALEAGGLFSEPEWNDILEALAVSPQQRRIVTLLFEGMAEKRIARHLEMAFPTFRTHMTRIFTHLGVRDRAGVMLRVVREFRRRCHGCPRRRVRCHPSGCHHS